MKRLLFYIIFLTVRPPQTQAQFAFYNEHYTEGKYTFELSADGGAMNCLTDLGGNKGRGRPFLKDLNIEETHFAYGISGAFNYKRLICFRLQFVHGKISGDDNLLKNAGASAKGRYLRNLNFSSSIDELAALFEFSPLMMIAKEGSWLPPADLYLFAGIGYYHFNPKTWIDKKEIELWPLHTEGQGFEEYPDRAGYKRNQFNIPFGSGIKFEILPMVNLRLEIQYRKIFTDYLDDVSTGYIDPSLFVKYLSPAAATVAASLADRRANRTLSSVSNEEIRGNSINKDSFFSLSLRVSLVLGRQRAP